MTEAEWLECTHPTPMLEFLRGKASDRKLRLFACACCRRICQYLKDKDSRRLVEVAESFADGAASAIQLYTTWNRAADAQEAIHYEGGDAVDQSAAEAVLGLKEELLITQVFEGIEEAAGEARAGEAWERVYNTPGKDYRTQEAEHNDECEAGAEAEQVVQSALLRDLLGNAFRPVFIDAAWLTPIVISLATAGYKERSLPSGELDQARLAVLADALEEAGCTDTSILEHLRSPGPHVRGCWAVDLLIGKE
jgi:hypothetical protein